MNDKMNVYDNVYEICGCADGLEERIKVSNIEHERTYTREYLMCDKTV